MTKHEDAGGVPPYMHTDGQEKRKLSRPGGAYLQVLTRPRRPKGEVTTARKIDVLTLPLSPLLPCVFPCRPRPTSTTSSLSSPPPRPHPKPLVYSVRSQLRFTSPPPPSKDPIKLHRIPGPSSLHGAANDLAPGWCHVAHLPRRSFSYL